MNASLYLDGRLRILLYGARACHCAQLIMRVRRYGDASARYNPLLQRRGISNPIQALVDRRQQFYTR